MKKIPGGCFVAVIVCFGGISLLLLALGIGGLLGHAHEVRFRCDRTSGKCVWHNYGDIDIALADFKDVEAKTEWASIGSHAHEKQTWIVAHMKDGSDRNLSQGSGDQTSIAEFKQAASDIHAFLVGDAPSIDVHYSERLGVDSIIEDLLLGVFCFVIFAVFPIAILRGRRRDAHAFDDAMKKRASDVAGAP